MHVVAVLALDGVVAFDLAVPGQVFGSSTTGENVPLYEVRVCGMPGGTETSATVGRMRVEPPFGLDALAAADTIVVPGHDRLHDRGNAADHPAEVLDALRDAASRGTRIASICVGAFVLAAAGLLDGRRATTHWMYACRLARLHPRVEVDASVLFVDDGQVLTSAGVAAGIDLCLHLVRRDHGAATAARTARRIIMPPQRDGGQAQFIRHEDPPDGGTALQPTLAWLEANLHRPLALEDIARHACVSVRTLTRRFREQAGTTPQQWLSRARVRRAQQLLESTDLPVERVAAEAGFGSPVTLRAHFARRVGASPQSYRAAFRARAS
ncbi:MULTISPECIES: GlxA family transcriptional regulator [Actinomadura]|uniref:Helix-turn-helix domain-containing protein n=1 Tax=Actinomadura litoris TaxID=2678616 RepID=A0A7K1L493_9ACTN|nr:MULTISPECIES: helix-turn-helix domain-containing protein [Actinomadura]MBT2209931.1 helix-turn-helix domain-containing protein [Actinomadura sp. NEAU-AAG7]MUN39242.1 helix-turn-helix domain-containing protein [Actinomadura litoris]